MKPLLSIEAAAARLREGAVLAYPTEGVWGLGCDPDDEAAVRRLLAVKQREVEKGLILIAARFEQLRRYLDPHALPAARIDEILATWPGPHTWVMPVAAAAPRWITGRHDGIAVRVSAHPPVVALCEAFGGALVSTSANLAGRPAPQRRDELDPALLARIDGVVEGETGDLQRPSTIRDARSGETLRG
ncbi:MAG: Sua5/YciO/YrdC/YwlC family protein [Pseudoxanthomonas sp.]